MIGGGISANCSFSFFKFLALKSLSFHVVDSFETRVYDAHIVSLCPFRDIPSLAYEFDGDGSFDIVGVSSGGSLIRTLTFDGYLVRMRLNNHTLEVIKLDELLSLDGVTMVTQFTEFCPTAMLIF
jgi:hypothetical protein